MKRYQKTKTLTALLLAVLLLAGLCACSKKEAAMPAGESASAGARKAMDMATEAPMAPTPAPEAEKYGYSNSSSAMTYTSAAQSVAGKTNAKLIYRASLELQVTSTEFDGAVTGLDQLVSEMGGYYEERSLANHGGGSRYGQYTVRVPADQFDAFCTRVGELCHVTYASSYTEDVSESYYDIESRLTTQRTKLERLQSLLAKAENMEDIITVESAISETEQAIESLTGSLRNYDSLVGYSTVSLGLQEVYKLSEEEQVPENFTSRLFAALGGGLRSFGNGVEDFIIGLAYNWVSVLVFVAIVVVVWRVVRRRSILRRRKKEQPPTPPSGE